MSVRSASRGSPAARSIRLALRTSSIVATSNASFVRWVLRWFGRRRLSSELMLSAISVMPFMSRFQGPPRAKALNHKPTPHVNSLPVELIDGKAYSHHRTGFERLVAAVGLAQFGLILVTEVSSLSALNSDWQRVIELCTVLR